MKTLLALFLLSATCNAESLNELAYMVSKIENVNIECDQSGLCSVKGKNTKEAKRIMLEVVGPGLQKDGWNGKIKIQ